MTFLKEFKNRGYFYQCTNEDVLDRKMNNQKIVAYVGFDCTAKSLHVGNLMQVMILRLLQQHGHKPIILIGGATTKIGDPTGKEEARKYLSDEEIESNIAGIKESLSKFIRFGDGLSDAIMLNNSQWLESLGYIEFLRDMGKMFSINRMLTMDSVRLRLEREQSLTFLEFNYMLLQDYDFYYLNKEFDCDLQLGGSDQWGNIVTGVELVRKVSSKESFGLTTPLLTTASGVKMGKSIDGAVWLNEDQLTSYDYYQYWRNVDDAMVSTLLRRFTILPMDEIKKLEALEGSEINEAKKILAFEATKLCHGEPAAQDAETTAQKVFEQGTVGGDLPSITIESTRLQAGVLAIDLFVESGLVSSKGEARRLIKAGGAKIDDTPIANDTVTISTPFPEGQDYIKLSAGKKKHALVKSV